MTVFELLQDYSFWTVALGTCFLALSASMIGTISVLTKQSLIGDSLGHAAYPGVIFSFIVFQSRNPFLLMLGAVVSGYLSYGLVQLVKRHSQHSLINILALSCFHSIRRCLVNLSGSSSMPPNFFPQLSII
ncbi:metal ABC transporter permease [Streptococcus sp. X13SY08]|uniref:metal ABC transporter permease n=1 Tax=Streptococcus sp. X13SY08 TaxID=1676616 RepID=UPI0022A9916A|nr:metal ABC transporter permease [Streptococcus sp. X13SY08]